MIYAGLDVGTTNCKITIFENENVIDSIFLSYPSIRNENQQTIDPLIILKGEILPSLLPQPESGSTLENIL